jgi:ubiquilin
MGPQAREMLQSPMFRQMMTNPDMLRQAAQMRRMMGGGGGSSAFPAPGATDTTPEGQAASVANPTVPGQAGAANPFGNLFGPGAGFPAMPAAGAMGGGAANPFGSLFGPGSPFGQPSGITPTGTPGSGGGQGTPAGQDAPANPFAALMGDADRAGIQHPFGAQGEGLANASPFGLNGQNPFGLTPEQFTQLSQQMGLPSFGDYVAQRGFGAGGLGGAGSPPPPADTRPPEEMYADQLRQLNDMGFFDFDQNVQALRRAGGSVQGAINQLLGG